MPKTGKRTVIWFSEADLWMLPRLSKLAKKAKISTNRLIMVAIAASLETLEEEVPANRSFTLNGKEVTP